MRQKGGGRGRNGKHLGLAETDSGNGGRQGSFVGPRGVGKGRGEFSTWKVSQLHSLSIVPSIGPGLLIC